MSARIRKVTVNLPQDLLSEAGIVAARDCVSLTEVLRRSLARQLYPDAEVADGYRLVLRAAGQPDREVVFR